MTCNSLLVELNCIHPTSTCHRFQSLSKKYSKKWRQIASSEDVRGQTRIRVYVAAVSFFRFPNQCKGAES